MLPAKDNYRNMYHDNMCRACGSETETQYHVLEECAILHLVGDSKVYHYETFNEEEDSLKDVSTRIENIINQLDNYPNNKKINTTKRKQNNKR